MPRIDPQQLLKTLGVLLSPNGGIKSLEEVVRLTQLMSKFSKKLVSKCIYVQILKATSPPLLIRFLSENGWDLINQWFVDAINSSNWPLTYEILQLFLLCPIWADLLKENVQINQAPKYINQLRLEFEDNKIKSLAESVYQKWISILSPEFRNGRGSQRNVGLEYIDYENDENDYNEDEDDEDEENNEDEENERQVEKECNFKKEEPLPKLVIKVPSRNSNSLSQPVVIVKSLSKDSLKSFKKIPESSSVEEGSISLLQSLAEEVSDNLKREAENSFPVLKAAKAQYVLQQEPHQKETKLPNVSNKRKNVENNAPLSKNSKVSKKIKSIPHHPRDAVNDDEKQRIKAKAKQLKEEALSKKDKTKVETRLSRIPKISKKLSETKKTPSFSDLLGGLDAKPKTVKTPLNKNKTAALLEGLTSQSNSKTASKLSRETENKVFLKKERKLGGGSGGGGEIGLGKKEDKKHLANNHNHNNNANANANPSSSSTCLENDRKHDVYESNSLSSKSSNSIQTVISKSKKVAESSSFMDAIFSSIGDSMPRRKKRRLSEKDESKKLTETEKKSKSDSEDVKQSNNINDDSSSLVSSSSPTSLSTTNIITSNTPFSFYRDTLDETIQKIKENDECLKMENEEKLPFDEEPTDSLPREVKGILVYHRGKEKRNKGINWKSDISSIRYFDYDETERVNVNKIKTDFTNMRKMEFSLEKARRDSKNSLCLDEEEEENDEENEENNDEEEEEKKENKENEIKKKKKTSSTWYKPFEISVRNRSPFTPGKTSREREIQREREASVLQAIYFSKDSIPETPQEPDDKSSNSLEPSSSFPLIIPLDDKEAPSEESIKDFSELGWPSPKIESSLSSFSLPSSLSHFLSSMNSSTSSVTDFTSRLPLSQDEQKTLEAQTQALQTMGLFSGRETALIPPPIEPSLSQPPPHSDQQNLLPHSSSISHLSFSVPPPSPNNNNERSFSMAPPFSTQSFGDGYSHYNDFRRGNFHNGRPFRGRGGFRQDNNNNNGHRGGGGGGGGHRDARYNPIYNESSTGRLNSRPCKFFHNRGHCRDGNRCRFSHDR